MGKDDISFVRIKAFRAIDEPKLCNRFIEGHRRVLTAVGVDQVTSSTNDWKHNPASFVLICESQDGEKVLGGARVHAFGGSQDLPIEEATSDMDNTISEHIRRFAKLGTGELCGLWNSMEVAGMGIGAMYLIRAATAVLEQLQLDTLWALCSPFSVRLARNYGYRVYPHVGNEGTFYYPKIDLIATACLLQNTSQLENVVESEIERIKDLRRNPIQKINELSRGRKINIEYELKISNINQSVIKRN